MAEKNNISKNINMKLPVKSFASEEDYLLIEDYNDGNKLKKVPVSGIGGTVATSINKPVLVANSFVYSGDPIDIMSVVNNYQSEQVSVSGDLTGTNVGTYSITFVPKSGYGWKDGTADPIIYEWEIERAVITNIPSQKSNKPHYNNGSTITAEFDNYDSTKMIKGGTYTGVNAGSYEATFIPTSNYKWADNSITAKTVSWDILNAVISSVPSLNGSYTYDGSAKSLSWNNYNSNQLTIANPSDLTNAGNKSTTFTPKINYEWAAALVSNNIVTGVKATYTVNWNIARRTISSNPTQSNTLTYNGSTNTNGTSQTPTWSMTPSDSATSSVASGDTASASNAGTYTLTFTPDNNHKWSDGTYTGKKFNWTIGKKTVSCNTCPSQTGTLPKYTGSTIYPTLTTYNSNEFDISGTTYATNVGTYSMYFTPKSNFKWSDGTSTQKTCQWTIKPATRVMTITIDQSNSTPSSGWTYSDDASTSMTDAEWDEFFGFYPVMLKNGIEQYRLNPNDFSKKADGTTADITSGNDGDVMIAFPRRGLKITTNGNNLTISITDEDNKSGYGYKAHSRGSTKKNTFYIGAYLGYESGGKLRSLSGKTPTANKTIGTFRNLAQANGSGYDQVGFYQLTMLQAMYLLKYRSRDSQTALGKGYTNSNNSACVSTGGMNAKGMCYGSTNDKEQMKLFGIEDFWGNLFWWIDGLFCNSSRQICTTTQNFNNVGSGYDTYYSNGTSNLSANVNGWIKTVQGTTDTGFIIKEQGGSSTTYIPDYAYLAAGYLPSFGGYWDDDLSAGAFRLYVYGSASDADAAIGAREMYL